MPYSCWIRWTAVGLLLAAPFAPAAGRSDARATTQATFWVADNAAPMQNGAMVSLSPATSEFRKSASIASAQHAIEAFSAATNATGNLLLLDVQAPADGPALVRFARHINGIEVYGARASVLLDRNLQARGIQDDSRSVSPVPAAASFPVDESTALDSALRQIDESVIGLDARPLPTQTDRYRRFSLSPSTSFVPGKPARVKKIWYPLHEDLVPAYYIEFVGQRRDAVRPIAVASIVSASDARVLHRHSLIHDLQPFGYRVFAGPDGVPYVDAYGFTNPHPTGTPNGYAPTLAAPMSLVTLSHAGLSTGDPWLADGATETRGNNVDAFFNGDVLDASGFCTQLGYGPDFNAQERDFRAPLSAAGRFDYSYNVAAHAQDYFQCLGAAALPIPTGSEQLRAKIVQAFYATNWLHDYFYDLGYDEIAGNPQVNNYGRGGLQNDPLIVHAGYDTTFAYGPADGESPALSLGNNARSRTHRDVSAFDFGVLAHEWTHTMFGRLAGTHFYLGQEGALNEGYADFVGLLMTVRAQDRDVTPGPGGFNATYAVGAYMNLEYDYPSDPLPPAGTAGNPDNTYFHGIRRFPSTTDMEKNPLTFRHISVNNPLPATWNGYDWKARSLQNSELHTAGEVWTAALWECARNILVAAPAAQFESTRRRIFGYVVAGMKLLPLDPTYIEARNALLFAIRANSEDDYLQCRSGLAKRGLGAGAISPDRHSYSLNGAVESFRDSDAAVSITSSELVELDGDGDGVLDPGESGQLRITLTNSGLIPLSHLRLDVPAIPGWYTFPAGSLADDIALQPDQSTTVSFAARVTTRWRAKTVFFAVSAFDTQHPDAADFRFANAEVNYDLRRDSSIDTLQLAHSFAVDWTHSFDGPPHGCAQYICSTDADVPSGLAQMLDWQRTRHRGSTAYVIGDPHMAIASALETAEFSVSTTTPLRLLLRHAYDLDRQAAPASDRYATPGLASVELSIDGGAWQKATAYSASGSGNFSGASVEWRNDILDFGNRLAGRRLRLRLHLVAGSSWVADDVYWAISRIAIEGNSTPVFSTVHDNAN